jgi:hypothetical protein
VKESRPGQIMKDKIWNIKSGQIVNSEQSGQIVKSEQLDAPHSFLKELDTLHSFLKEGEGAYTTSFLHNKGINEETINLAKEKGFIKESRPGQIALNHDDVSNNQEATAQDMLEGLETYDSTVTDNPNLPDPIKSREVVVEPTRLEKAKSEALKTILPVGQFFKDKEDKELARLNALDEKKRQNQQLKKILLLKNQNLLGAEDTKILDAINILSNPEAIRTIQDYPVERTSIIQKKKGRKAYINTNPEPTYESTAPNLWYLN